MDSGDSRLVGGVNRWNDHSGGWLGRRGFDCRRDM